jgi:hypothetical protein
MEGFVKTFARVYPCGYCADTTSEEVHTDASAVIIIGVV